MRLIDSIQLILESDGKSVPVIDIVNAPTVDAIPIPQKYAAMTTFNAEDEYTIELSIPITKEQFKAIAKGTDIWEVLKE